MNTCCDPDIFLEIGSEKFSKVNNFPLFSEISHLFEEIEEMEAGIVRPNNVIKDIIGITVLCCTVHIPLFSHKLKIILRTSCVQRLNVTAKSHKVLSLQYHIGQIILYCKK